MIVPYVVINQQNIFYRQQGTTRPPLLMVHGAGGSSWHFQEVLHLTGQHFCSLTLDLPGHGKSPIPNSLPTVDHLFEYYRETVALFAEKLGLGKFVLVGHSMGGAVALEFARVYPERLAGLVLISTAARFWVAPDLKHLLQKQFEKLPSYMAAMGYSPVSDAPRVECWAMQQIQAPQPIVDLDFSACSHFDMRQPLSRLTGPTLILSAADDRLTPPSCQEELVRILPRSRQEIISRTGHFMLQERPDEVARLIKANLDRLGSG